MESEYNQNIRDSTLAHTEREEMIEIYKKKSYKPFQKGENLISSVYQEMIEICKKVIQALSAVRKFNRER